MKVAPLTFEAWLDECRAVLSEKGLEAETIIDAVGVPQWEKMFSTGWTPRKAVEEGVLFYWNG